MHKSKIQQHPGKLAWIDLEMTGLDPDADEIIEMAMLITDKSLSIIAESKVWVFACDAGVLAGMDKWNTKTHSGSGLLDEVRASSLDYATGEREAMEFLSQWVEKGVSPMCGNTICQDRRFLSRHMPQLHNYFHYRNFDVTSYKLGALFWFNEAPVVASKNNVHRAMADIRESVEEMRLYREMLFKS